MPLAQGPLISDPVRLFGAKGDFATGTIQVSTEDGAILASLIAFGDAAVELLKHQAGDALAIAGWAKLSSWTGPDGADITASV